MAELSDLDHVDFNQEFKSRIKSLDFYLKANFQQLLQILKRYKKNQI